MKQIAIVILAVLFLTACSDNRKSDASYIKQLESKTFSSKAIKPDQNLAMELIAACADYQKKYKDDSLAPKFLFKAGEVAMSIENGKSAISYFEEFEKCYPENVKAAHCVFLTAFIYETQLKDLVKAKEKYTDFINKYPNHEMVKDAIASIEMLGKSPEEIIKSFGEKQQQPESK